MCFWYYTLHFSWIYLRHWNFISLSQSSYTPSNKNPKLLHSWEVLHVSLTDKQDYQNSKFCIPFQNYEAKVSILKGNETVLSECTSEMTKRYEKSAHSRIQIRQQCFNIHEKLCPEEERWKEQKRKEKKRRGRQGRAYISAISLLDANERRRSSSSSSSRKQKVRKGFQFF